MTGCDIRALFTPDDGELILFRDEVAVIRSTGAFLAAPASGESSEGGAG